LYVPRNTGVVFPNRAAPSAGPHSDDSDIEG
jgi:hypothetical protein